MINKTKGPPDKHRGAKRFEAGGHSMTHNIVHVETDSVRVPIPFGYQPDGQHAKQQALILYHLLRWTAATEERRTWGFYIDVHSNTWRKLIGSRYLDALRVLKSAGVIEIGSRNVDGRRVESYSTGNTVTKSFAKGYRLTDKYRTGKSELFEFTNKRHCQKLRRHHDIDFDSLQSWDIWHFGNLQELTIDVDAIGTRDQWAVLSASNILNGFHFFKVCDYQRRHTLLTQLSRDARSALRYGTQQDLAICDVSACQPLLLGYLVGVNYDHHDTRFELLRPLDRSKIEPDVRHWIELCESREIYSHLHNAVLASSETLKIFRYSAKKQRCFPIDYQTMSATGFKRSCLIPLFDRLSEMELNPVFIAIEREFPTIARYLRTVKAKHHATAASLCQRLESRLMQHGAMKELFENQPNELNATIHDAILTVSHNVESVRQAIRNQFTNLRLEPTIKAETI